MIQTKVDKILSNAIFIGHQQAHQNNYLWPVGTKVSVIISILSDDQQYEEYEIDNKTFNGFQWHKLMCHPNNLKHFSKYYGLTYLIIHNALKSGKNILIHSTETHVRAGFMLAIYLMLENKWTHQETLQYINQVRPDIELSSAYINELQILEQNYSKYTNIY